MSAIISGLGVYIPDQVLTNKDLENMVETSDEWITTRTGIKERRIVGSGSELLPSDIGAHAAKQAIEQAGISPLDIDGIMCATAYGDKQFPATACFIQKKIGADNAFAFDITAACAGFVFGVNMASQMINSGQCKHILVVGSEILSRIVNWKDRNTCILFGDGAGAAVISKSMDDNRGILASTLQSDGRQSDILYMENTFSQPNNIQMDGKQVFKVAVNSLTNIILKTLKKVELASTDIDLAVFHQANLRILNAVAERLGLSQDKLIINVQKYGNTSAASVPLTLFEAQEQGLLHPGKLIVLAAIGGGMSWGCNLLRW